MKILLNFFTERSKGLSEVDVSEDMSLEELRKLIAAKRNVSTERVRIVFKARILNKNRTLRELNVRDKDTLSYTISKTAASAPNEAQANAPTSSTASDTRIIDPAFETKLQKLIKIGFAKEKAAKTLERHAGDLVLASNSLLLEANSIDDPEADAIVSDPWKDLFADEFKENGDFVTKKRRASLKKPEEKIQRAKSPDISDKKKTEEESKAVITGVSITTDTSEPIVTSSTDTSVSKEAGKLISRLKDLMSNEKDRKLLIMLLKAAKANFGSQVARDSDWFIENASKYIEGMVKIETLAQKEREICEQCLGEGKDINTVLKIFELS